MAQASISNQILDQAILDGIAEDIVISSHPGIEDRPKVFSAFTAATACLIQPHLESLVQAYRQACMTRTGREAARLFIENMIEAES